jgi:hypothetical protein
MDMSVDDILASLSHLTAAQVHSALAYYFNHQDEIDNDLRESSEETHWKEKALKHPKKEGTFI